jgi:serine protease Do
VGIGFAIPSNVADQITKKLISGGKITRGYLGATIQNVTPDLAESMGLGKEAKGALVADLVPGGPAQKAGLLPGDVVLSLNGHSVGSSTELTRLVAQSQNGDIMHVTVLRDGKTHVVDVRSGVRPSEAQLARQENGQDDQAGPDAGGPQSKHSSTLGMMLGALDDDTRGKLGVPETVHGAVILGVKGSSDAGEKGLKTGDIIVMAGETQVSSPADVAQAAAAAKKEGRTAIRLGVRRDGHTLFLPIKLG